MLLKNKFFWISTALFLLATMAGLWKIYPPIIKEFRELGEKDKVVSEQIVNAEAYSASIKALKVNSSTLDSVYASAGRALPISARSDLLLLDIEGLTNAVGLKGVTITVPFQGASTATATQSPTSSGDDEAKRGNTATTKPVIKDGAADAVTVTISGNINYDKVNELLAKLKTFSRWNKIKGIDIVKTADTYATTLSLEVFTKAAPTTGFTDTSAEFLKGAQALFTPLQAYATEPNAKSEGEFGKSNPFN